MQPMAAGEVRWASVFGRGHAADCANLAAGSYRAVRGDLAFIDFITVFDVHAAGRNSEDPTECMSGEGWRCSRDAFREEASPD
jgi:hypothetical protein